MGFGSFIKNIIPAATTAAGAYFGGPAGAAVAAQFGGALQQHSQGSDVAGIIKDYEQRKFDDQKAYNDAVNAYNARHDQWAQGQAAASRAASAARASAARQTQANQRRAAKKAHKKLNKAYDQTMETYRPFSDAALSLLPQMQSTYTSGLNTANLLSAYLNRPENMAMLSGSKPAGSIEFQLPEWMKK